jgi:hypothetical protein
MGDEGLPAGIMAIVGAVVTGAITFAGLMLVLFAVMALIK